MLPVPGDYDGDGIRNLCVYNQGTGMWYILSREKGLLLWDYNWGGGALQPALWGR